MDTREVLPVIFRYDPEAFDGEGETVAIFPTLPASNRPGDILCYARLGQHSGCALAWYRERTRPATPEEYAPLLAELRSIYESDRQPALMALKVCHRMTAKMTEARELERNRHRAIGL